MMAAMTQSQLGQPSARSLEQVNGSASERAALEQLMQLYVYDFAEILPPERRVHLQDDGRFPPLPHLDEYWAEADRSVWFLRAGGVLCGFALLPTARRARSAPPRTR